MFGWATHIRDRLRKLTKDDSLPYVCSYAISASYTLPADLDFTRHPGRGLCHVTRLPGQNSQLAVFWRDEDHCRVHNPAFAALLGLPAPFSGGTVAHVNTPRIPLLKKFSLKDSIVVISGVLALMGFGRHGLRNGPPIPKRKSILTTP